MPSTTVQRFTVDGDAALEAQLAALCVRVNAGVEQIIPERDLQGILLGGGYGRGEGGVDRSPEGDKPYNDLEFYVFVRGPLLLQERRYNAALVRLGHELSEIAGIEVEFKLASSERLRRGAVSMFTYDLVMGHRRVRGDATMLHGCDHHRDAEAIPLEEATRLLMNRASGLLFARARLLQPTHSQDDLDFVVRNIAKARLALGDVVLSVFGRYHWSVLERERRMSSFAPAEAVPSLEEIRREHSRGVRFKLHPRRATQTVAELRDEHTGVSELAMQVWLWLESQRLGVAFRSPLDYALHPANKCPGMPPLRNFLVNLRRFGWRALGGSALRYPRERLFRALPVLLWQPAFIDDLSVRVRLQRELYAEAAAESGLLRAYTALWEVFR